jgi:hypothetical protein
MNNAKYCIIACILAIQAAGSAALAQTTITDQITTDTYLDSANANSNYGLSGSDKVVINSTSICRTLFDLPANLWSYSPGSIESAIVSFYVFQDNTQTYNVSLLPLTRGFVVGTGGSSGLIPANGATWNTYDGITSWTTAGGDFDSANAVVGTKGPLGPNPGDPSGRFFTFDITSLLNNPTTGAELQDFGAMLSVDFGQTAPATGQRYDSFTSADTTHYTAPYLPFVQLTVVPEPSSWILVTVGLVAITCFRKKRIARC